MRAPRLRYVVLFAVSSFIVAVIAATFSAEVSKIKVLNNSLDKKMTELEKLERTNLELKRRLENAKTSTAVEREARDKYNLLKPGEKMYKIEIRKHRQ